MLTLHRKRSGKFWLLIEGFEEMSTSDWLSPPNGNFRYRDRLDVCLLETFHLMFDLTEVRIRWRPIGRCPKGRRTVYNAFNSCTKRSNCESLQFAQFSPAR